MSGPCGVIASPCFLMGRSGGSVSPLMYVTAFDGMSERRCRPTSIVRACSHVLQSIIIASRGVRRHDKEREAVCAQIVEDG